MPGSKSRGVCGHPSRAGTSHPTIIEYHEIYSPSKFTLFMPSQEYCEKTQLDLLDEIIESKKAGSIQVDRDTPEREWNYNFLLTQGYIVRECGTTDLWGRPVEEECDGWLLYERVTDEGKAWRAELYKRQNPSEFQTKKYLVYLLSLVSGAISALLSLFRVFFR
jgi:hypothetical protein